MGSRAKVVTLYGICYEYGGTDHAIIENADTDEPVEGSPRWLLDSGKTYVGVQIVPFGHYDCCGFALAAVGTVKMGRDWQPLELPSVEPGQQPDAAFSNLMAYCEKHGLTFRDPDWWAVPYYG